ncbi:MAG: (d)CMP kinase [Actinomycetota bacterium]|nr:(d)CMP kinase [Actinomycetota bacterium]
MDENLISRLRSGHRRTEKVKVKLSKHPVIAIDGPAAAGKSTVSILLAERLSLDYIDSGSMYRAVTLVAMEEKVSLNDENALVDVAKSVSKEYFVKLERDYKPEVFLGKREISSEIRSPEVGRFVSEVSAVEGVRKIMVSLQRKMAKRGAVVEGRDIGSSVFPNADLKIYLEADVKERVRRRLTELKNKGIKLDWDDVEKEILHRDRIDSSRKISPLSISADSFVIDTTNMNQNEVAERIIRECEKIGISPRNC